MTTVDSLSISARADWRLRLRRRCEILTSTRSAFGFRIPRSGSRQRDALRGSAIPGKKRESNLSALRKMCAQGSGNEFRLETLPRRLNEYISRTEEGKIYRPR